MGKKKMACLEGIHSLASCVVLYKFNITMNIQVRLCRVLNERQRHKTIGSKSVDHVVG
jgi:hypothetical protein